jgi:hypothetical protein
LGIYVFLRNVNCDKCKCTIDHIHFYNFSACGLRLEIAKLVFYRVLLVLIWCPSALFVQMMRSSIKMRTCLAILDPTVDLYPLNLSSYIISQLINVHVTYRNNGHLSINYLVKAGNIDFWFFYSPSKMTVFRSHKKPQVIDWSLNIISINWSNMVF